MASRAENRIGDSPTAGAGVPVLNALLGLRTALAPVSVVCLSGSALLVGCAGLVNGVAHPTPVLAIPTPVARRETRGPLPAGLDSRACTSWTVPVIRGNPG